METPSISRTAYGVSSETFLSKRPLTTTDSNTFGVSTDALNPQQQGKKQGIPMSKSRIVKVFIADPDENLPLEKRVIYSGEERLTDLDDQELYFEIPIKELLDKHNAARKATADKKASEKFGREIMLEAARIRDLKMVVVTVAAF